MQFTWLQKYSNYERYLRSCFSSYFCDPLWSTYRHRTPAISMSSCSQVAISSREQKNNYPNDSLFPQSYCRLWLSWRCNGLCWVIFHFSILHALAQGGLSVWKHILVFGRALHKRHLFKLELVKGGLWHQEASILSLWKFGILSFIWLWFYCFISVSISIHHWIMAFCFRIWLKKGPKKLSSTTR